MKVIIKILRLFAIVLFVGIIVAYICIPFSDMPYGIQSLVTMMKQNLIVDGGPPLILLILWIALLVAEIPFAISVKDNRNVFADENNSNKKRPVDTSNSATEKNGKAESKKNTRKAKEKTADKKKAEEKPKPGKSAEKTLNTQKAKEKPNGKKEKQKSKNPTEKTLNEQKKSEKPVGVEKERIKPKVQKAPDRKPTTQKNAEATVSKGTNAQKPNATDKVNVKRTVPQGLNTQKTGLPPTANNAKKGPEIKTKTNRTNALDEVVKDTPLLIDDENFDQFLKSIKYDYLNNKR